MHTRAKRGPGWGGGPGGSAPWQVTLYFSNAPQKSGNKDGLNELSHYQDGVLCSVSPGLTVWPMGGVGDGVRWPELPNSVRWGEGEGPERGREAEKEGKRGR